MTINKIRSHFIFGTIFLSFLLVILNLGQISFAAEGDTINSAQGTFGDSVQQNPDTINSAMNGSVVESRGNCDKPRNIGELFSFTECLLSDYVIPFLFALALVVFLVGVVRYVAGGDNEEKRTQGRDIMWFGIIALFVMVGVWGFVKMLVMTFGFEYKLPSLPEKSSKVFGN